jgi:hypothetical protein
MIFLKINTMAELIKRYDALSKIYSSEIAKINEFIESDGAVQLREFGRIFIKVDSVFGKDIKDDDVKFITDLLEEYGWDVELKADSFIIS